MKFLEKNKLNYPEIILIGILLVGGYLRFSTLSWGSFYPFHPDERNMADAIVRLPLFNLDPRFYAYGQFPLYLAYFSQIIILFITKRKLVDQLSFSQAVLALRFWSAFFSTLTIYFGYLISKKLFSSLKPSKNTLSKDFIILLTPLLIAFTPGLIQTAHFGTTESILAFSLLAITYYSLEISSTPRFKTFFLAAVCLGIALGSKISAAIFFIPIVLASFFQFLKSKGVKGKIKVLLFFAICLAISLALGILTSPYLLLAYKESKGTLFYEVSVAQGISQVFYTRQFLQTPPILFQLQKIFPYTLGVPIFIFGGFGFLVIFFQIIKGLIKRGEGEIFYIISLMIIFSTFLFYFLSQAFLFTKWTRFMAPLFPFFSIFTAIFVSKVPFNWHSPRLAKFFSLLLVTYFIFPGAIFSSIYFRPDIRFEASEWIFKNIPTGTKILYDTGNVVDVPILPPQSKVLKQFPGYNIEHVSFDFYHLDEEPKLFPKLIESLTTSDYIFVPSRRIFMNYSRFPDRFPRAVKYYQLLFSEKLGFRQIAEFKRFDDEKAEETFTVFDHPVIRIYKKKVKLTKEGYENLFQ